MTFPPSRQAGRAVAKRAAARPLSTITRKPGRTETAAGRADGGRPPSRDRSHAKLTAAALARGMRICRTSFTDDGGVRVKAGRSWWHASAIPPRFQRYFASSVEETVAVQIRHREPEGLYGVPPRRRFNKWRL